MELYSRKFAAKAHADADTRYGDNLPYTVHLDQVVGIIKEFWHSFPLKDFYSLDMVIDIGYLHDVIEDTKETFDSVNAEFGIITATAVQALTWKEGRNRRERQLNSWHIIRENIFAVFVKLADRLAHMRFGIAAQNKRGDQFLAMYRKEFPAFEAALFVPGQFTEMWEHLRQHSIR